MALSYILNVLLIVNGKCLSKVEAIKLNFVCMCMDTVFEVKTPLAVLRTFW